MRLLSISIGLCLVLTLVPGTALGQESISPKAAIVQEKVIAGGPKDFMEVRHLVIKGTNEQVGEALATIAKERHQLKLEARSDRLRTRALRRYIEKNYPILL